MRAGAGHIRLVAALCLIAILGACADELPPDAGNQPMEAPAEVTGVVESIKPPEGEIEGFVVRTVDDGSVDVTIDPDVDYGFDLQHLHEHMETAEPVKVELDSRDGKAYAVSIEDV